MEPTVPRQMLIDRKTLRRLLGGISVSHVIRLERSGNLAQARVAIGRRIVRYDAHAVKDLVEKRRLY